MFIQNNRTKTNIINLRQLISIIYHGYWNFIIIIDYYSSQFPSFVALYLYNVYLQVAVDFTIGPSNTVLLSCALLVTLLMERFSVTTTTIFLTYLYVYWQATRFSIMSSAYPWLMYIKKKINLDRLLVSDYEAIIAYRFMFLLCIVSECFSLVAIRYIVLLHIFNNFTIHVICT